MVVMDAGRSGVSQLHQLRGGIGRGDVPGFLELAGDERAAYLEKA
jgi:ATP-dependent DNA helicase RecG